MAGFGTELFVLLLAGHLIADYVVQTRRVAVGIASWARAALGVGLPW